MKLSGLSLPHFGSANCNKHSVSFFTLKNICAINLDVLTQQLFSRKVLDRIARSAPIEVSRCDVIIELGNGDRYRAIFILLVKLCGLNWMRNPQNEGAKQSPTRRKHGWVQESQSRSRDGYIQPNLILSKLMKGHWPLTLPTTNRGNFAL